MKSYCKIKENVRILDFGHGSQFFNGTRGSGEYDCRIYRQFTDSIEIEVKGLGELEEFKLTNQSLVTWDDYWLNIDTGMIVDPLFKRVNLQRNELVYVNINTPRLGLQELNVEGNAQLKHLYIHEAPRLETLNLSGCKSLEYIALGSNKAIKSLIAKDCEMQSNVMEQLLRDFTPVITSSANFRGAGAFRKNYSTLLDLRGNTVDWGNRNVASKIRLLLTNNWIVKWDNNPPYDIVPPSMYAFYVESLIDT